MSWMRARDPPLAGGERIAQPQGFGGNEGVTDGYLAHGLHAAGDNNNILRAAHDRLGSEMDRLLRRPAHPVDRHPRNGQRQPGREPTGPRDVERQRPDRIDRAEHHVVVVLGRDSVALDDMPQHVPTEVAGMHMRQPAPATAGRRANSIDDESFGHGKFPYLGSITI
jgi:hypothetical protein